MAVTLTERHFWVHGWVLALLTVFCMPSETLVLIPLTASLASIAVLLTGTFAKSALLTIRVRWQLLVGMVSTAIVWLLIIWFGRSSILDDHYGPAVFIFGMAFIGVGFGAFHRAFRKTDG